MCTLILAFQQHPDWPVVLAANRDEFRARAASGPRRWPGEAFVAPVDEEAHGTWLGLTASGAFIGVTNRHPAQRHPERRSRGLLVVDALRQPDAASVRRLLQSLDPRTHNAFHLVYVDPLQAFVTWSDGEKLHHQTLAPGLHVVTERSFADVPVPRVQLVEASWPRVWPAGSSPDPRTLGQLLATRKPGDPFSSLCVDAFDGAYGTRSALVWLQHADVRRSRLLWADGSPDRVPFDDRPDLLVDLADLTSKRVGSES